MNDAIKHKKKARLKFNAYNYCNKTLITLAETAGEAMSDFTGYAKQNDLKTCKGSLCTLKRLLRNKQPKELKGICNIIDNDSELPSDLDSWFAIAAMQGRN